MMYTKGKTHAKMLLAYARLLELAEINKNITK